MMNSCPVCHNEVKTKPGLTIVTPDFRLENLCPKCFNLACNNEWFTLTEIMVVNSTNVVNLKTSKYDVFIGRPSKWGNPFKIGKDGTRSEVIKKYEQWIRTQPNLLKDLIELKGKTLGCYCKPEACHGDILIKLIKEKFK